MCAAAVLLLVPLLTTRALDPDLTTSQYNHNVWQTEDGLPQNTIQAVVQTRDGYVWLGTQEGLARFDGVRFVVFNRENTPAMKNNVFLTLFEDRDGALWIGTEGGLLKYKDEQFVLYTTDDGLVSTSSGSLWTVRTADSGSVRWAA